VVKRKLKNKKILALLCVPVLVVSMILPLCSFTTVYDSEYDVYSSISNACVPYTYKYGNTGLYFGLLNNCARCLIDKDAKTIAQKKDSIKYTASDYYITSSYRISIDGSMSDFVDLDGGYERLSLFYKTTNKDKVFFPLHCYAENINPYDNLEYGYYIEGNGDLFLINVDSYDITCDINFTYTWIDNNNGELVYASERMSTSIQIGSNNTDDGLGWVLRPYEFVDLVLREDYGHITENPNFIYGYCSVFDCDITCEYKGQNDVFVSGLDGVMVSSNVHNVFGEFYNEVKLEPFTDELQYIYSIAYGKGFDSGVSSAPQVWGSISDFLENTIGGFLEFEFVDGVSFGGLISVFLGFILVFSFLKMFAGG
jgi:hypothetical protein